MFSQARFRIAPVVQEDSFFEKTWVRNSTVPTGDVVQVGTKFSQIFFDAIEIEFEGIDA